MESQYTFNVILITEIHPDPEQPRKDARNDNERGRLIASIQKYGIETPLSVMRLEDGEYRIIDGHRRYFAAKEIGLEKLPCRIYEKMQRGELESRRFEIQNNRRSWRPLERASILSQIKKYLKLESNRELSDHLHISETLAANSLQLIGVKIEYLEMMKDYELPESYQIEFLRLKPKLRRIKEFEVDEVIERIFEKIKCDVIHTSKDLRRLGSLFIRSTANEEALYSFLSDNDMNIATLLTITSRSSVSLYAEQLMGALAAKKNVAEALDESESLTLKELSKLLTEIL